jgi:hypothetical protein
MPPVVVDLKVTRFEQRPGRCGAATAQMILFYKRLTGDQLADQDAMWGLIKGHTSGPGPRSTITSAPIDPTDCPVWAMQQCDRCPAAATFKCWCTYPPALEQTLAVSNPLPMTLSPPAATAEFVTAAAIASVDFDIPAAALISNGLHWIAVDGYEIDGNAAQLINGRMISEIYICDPAVNAANHSVAIHDWLNDSAYMSPVIQCGLFRNRVVVLAATGPLPGPPPLVPPTAPVNIRVIGRRNIPKRRRKPIPPPRSKRR